ncbi:hypothetical protein P43SY_009119 [Pythium insidiosum]|uniref:Uncharacterized protein n=1 Tax=Pythium insidiosum TaxID=114742 RepID=A0AAD5LA53_PYTIN|nr:hypothetical protein P43SY_009119 [Pythium insidiosum]
MADEQDAVSRYQYRSTEFVRLTNTRLQFNRLHELLHSQPLAIKDFEIRCRLSALARQTVAEIAEQEGFLCALVNTLLAPDSTLRPDRLVVCGGINEYDMIKMIEYISTGQAVRA